MILFRGGDTHSRSVLKAISWRTLGTLDTFAISWFLTGKVGLAGSIAALEFATKIVWYYLHERGGLPLLGDEAEERGKPRVRSGNETRQVGGLHGLLAAAHCGVKQI